jgi:glycine/D-amino acid oxidase-like deaminating enzyme
MQGHGRWRRLQRSSHEPVASRRDKSRRRVIDRHPGYDNVWLCGGGSGHGFKHGPAVGEFTAERVLKGDATHPRFTLASKQTVQQRSVH